MEREAADVRSFLCKAAEDLADLLTEGGTVFERALFNCGGSVRSFLPLLRGTVGSSSSSKRT